MFATQMGKKLLLIAAAAGLFNLMAANANACDHANTAAQAHQGVFKTFSGVQSPLAARFGNGGLPAQNNSTTAAKTIVGMWDVKDYYQGQLVDEYFDTWHSDGNELFIDASNPIEDNVCQGIWMATGTRTYKLKHESWYFDTTGTLLGWAIFHDTATLSTDGNSWTGTEEILVYDLYGNLLFDITGDELQATRIVIDF